MRDTALFDSDTIADAGDTASELFARRTSDSIIHGNLVTTVLWPVPQLLIVGAGAVAEALGRGAAMLGWQTQLVNDVATATGVIAGLAAPDNLVVAAHDVDVAGPALAAALDSDVGYIGALGARRMQQARADWLAYRDITDLSRIHGPAGLDLGAITPEEIALSILAGPSVRSASGGRFRMSDQPDEVRDVLRSGPHKVRAATPTKTAADEACRTWSCQLRRAC